MQTLIEELRALRALTNDAIAVQGNSSYERGVNSLATNITTRLDAIIARHEPEPATPYLLVNGVKVKIDGKDIPYSEPRVHRAAIQCGWKMALEIVDNKQINVGWATIEVVTK